jgi:hypothetical protein
MHKGVKLPAVINFANYTHGTGQVRSNSFIKSPWLKERLFLLFFVNPFPQSHWLLS